MTAAARDPRARMIAAVHVGAKTLGLDDATRRRVMQRVTGKTSSAEMSNSQLALVLDEYKRLAGKPSPAARPAARRKAADHPVAGKARALWISLHQLGVIRNPSDDALEAFARRQLQVEVFQWADQGLGYKLIEALKAIAERNGWLQDVASIPGPRQIRVLRERLVLAQVERVKARSALVGEEITPVALARLTPAAIAGLTDRMLRNETEALSRTIWAFAEPAH